MSQSARGVRQFHEDLADTKNLIALVHELHAEARAAPTTAEALRCLADAHTYSEQAAAQTHNLSVEASRIGVVRGLFEFMGLLLMPEEEERKTVSWTEGRTRAACHECGHALAYLLQRVDFTCARASGDEGDIITLPLPPGKTARLPPPEIALNLLVAGAVADEILHGAIRPYTVMGDLALALGVLGVTKASDLENDAVLVKLRDAVTATRAILQMHRDVLDLLSDALPKEIILMRDESKGDSRFANCVDLLRSHGVEVPDPVFDMGWGVLQVPDLAVLVPEPDSESPAEPAPQNLDDEELAQARDAFKQALAEAAAKKPPQS